MSDDSKQPSEAAIEELKAAFSGLKSALHNEDKPAEWRAEAQHHIDALYVFTNDFLAEQSKEREMLERGVGLDKDYPQVRELREFKKEKHLTKLDRQLPKRKSGYIDDMHQAEHGISKHFDALAKLLTKQDFPEDMQTYYHAMMDDLAGKMDDLGICLTQKKNFASKTTMPFGPDDTVPQERARYQNMFQKIDKIDPTFSRSQKNQR